MEESVLTKLGQRKLATSMETLLVYTVLNCVACKQPYNPTPYMEGKFKKLVHVYTIFTYILLYNLHDDQDKKLYLFIIN